MWLCIRRHTLPYLLWSVTSHTGRLSEPTMTASKQKTAARSGENSIPGRNYTKFAGLVKSMRTRGKMAGAINSQLVQLRRGSYLAK